MAKVKAIVQETRDYDLFSFLETNREASRGHIESLKNAFAEVGNLTRVQPILVNDRMQIIDGQHRFIAAQELGEPIFFTMVEGLGIHEARSMNILHRTWTVQDFARSYALGGNLNYQKYLNLMEDYEYPHSTVLSYVHNGDTRGAFKEFREGNFELTDETVVRERLDKLAQVNEVTPLARGHQFAMALLHVMKVDGYNHKQMITKIRMHPELMKAYGYVGDNLRMLEEVYNYRMHENNRLRLY